MSTLYPHQVPPEGDWTRRELPYGRGAGKTFAAAHEMLRRAADGARREDGLILYYGGREHIWHALQDAVNANDDFGCRFEFSLAVQRVYCRATLNAIYPRSVLGGVNPLRGLRFGTVWIEDWDRWPKDSHDGAVVREVLEYLEQPGLVQRWIRTQSVNGIADPGVPNFREMVPS